jgi:signal transduction histidine kinase/PleD family two-component response regulator
MNQSRVPPDALERIFSGESEMAVRMRGLDWSRTPLGPVESWSPSLRMMVRFLLANRFPMLLWWGPEYVSIYNDAYRPVLGTKHPWALAQPVRECWSEIWHILQPLIDRPFHGGPATWNDDLFVEINRHGFAEETHFTIAYSPVPDESAPSGIGGVLATVNEITEKVVGERRVRALRDLGSEAAGAKTSEEACLIAAETLAAHDKDVSFALLYLMDADRRRVRLAGRAGVPANGPGCPPVLDVDGGAESPWPVADVLRTKQPLVVGDLSRRFHGTVPSGPWSDPAREALLVPIRSSIPHELAGVLVAGVSARLKLDELYRSFLELVAGQIATSIANARAYEEERKRAEALAEIDRAKTAFFSNVSHEFRTPLTLLLGPLEELLSEAHGVLPQEAMAALSLAHRNGRRLLRLVNTVLDFARIEAGRVDAHYEPTDLATFTEGLASVFRSAVEKAGLRLTVECAPSAEPAYVDHDMWEKVVLNLLSNAFKYTFEGGIALRLAREGEAFVLTVQDTGIGIPQAARSRIFERFHRVEGARGRSHEGSGIGLALVHELVKLHGGTIGVESELGRGSTFRVSIPAGSAHLPAGRIHSVGDASPTAVRAGVFVEEALSWLPAATEESRRDRANGPRVLLADDNADLRRYATRLLEEHYQVEAVGDGEQALAAARARKPDLVITDIMMPNLDGFGLIRALRADEVLREVPIIALSARAGEEARVEGLQQGADDYLVKPFSARELVVRCETVLRSIEIRREAETAVRESEQRFRALTSATSEAVYRMSPDWAEMRRLEGREFIADTLEPSRTWLGSYIHQDDREEVTKAIERAIASKSVFQLEHRVLRVDGSFGWAHSRAVPILDERGEIVEWFGAAQDVTRRREAEAARERAMRTAEAARAEAEAANRAKDEFLATVSHELRSPLQGIMGWLSLLKQGRLDATRSARAFEAVERSVRLQAQLVHDIMDVSRIAAGKVEIERLPLDLTDVVRKTVDEFMPAAVSKNLHLGVDGEHSGLVMGDRERLHQVFSNLVSNALKFTPPGGRVGLTCERADGHAVVTVSDTGEGIEPEFLSRLFDRFTQADTSSTRRFGGLGLGLAIVRHLVELHGGTVSATSAGRGRGATFQVRLPEVMSAESLDPDPLPSARTSGLRLDGVQVLLVEDDRDALEAMKLTLEATGCTVRPAGSAKEAWSIYVDGKPDVVVSDLSMPEEDGYSLLRRIRSDGDGARVPAIALTGFTRPEDKQRVLAAGFAAHVAKPVDSENLVEVLTEVLRENAPHAGLH